MNNLFIPYELAVTAKEKGFSELCITCYDFNTHELINPIHDKFIPSCRNGEVGIIGLNITAPLYQQIVDWFREKHKIKFNFNTEVSDDQMIEFTHLTEDEWIGYTITIQKKSYYEAFDKAIEEAFKLI